jgi:PAS domain S-box-containing protein
VSRAIGRTHDVDGVYNAALDALAECLNVTRASVLLFDADGVMRFKAYRGLSSAYRAAVEGHSPWKPDSIDAEPLLVSDVECESSLKAFLPLFAREEIRALAFIPLLSVGRVIGKFMMYYEKPHVFDAEEVELAVVIAAAVAIAVERARDSQVNESREKSFEVGQHQVLAMIATGAPLPDVLALLVHVVEDHCEGVRCSVLLVDEDGARVRVGAAPNLPQEYVKRVDGHPIHAGASQEAALKAGRALIVPDLHTNPEFELLAKHVVGSGLLAYWRMPILSQNKKVLGSFGMFCNTPRAPGAEELRILETAADLAGVAIDHRQSQDALRQSEERNRAILRAIPDMMFVLSREGVYLDCHANDPDALLVPPEQFLGKSMYDVLPQWLAEMHQQAFDRALATNERELVEYSMEMPNERRFYEACIVPCDGTKLLSIVRDITDRKRAELDAAAQRQELAHLNRVLIVSEQSGALAHELSQPLAAVLSNAQAAHHILDRDQLDRVELHGALHDIIKSAKLAAAVINRLRKLLKNDTALLQPLDVNEIMREVLDLTRSDLLLRQMPIVTGLAPEMPPVLGDRVQLQQVILNLLFNACDSMITVEPAEREIRVSTVVDEEFVQITVADRGRGVPSDQLNAVFEPFVTHRPDGLGLGLSISRSIVIAHHGRIRAENNADRGATFRCFLPVAQNV